MADDRCCRALRLHPDLFRTLCKMPRAATENVWKVLRGLEEDPHPEGAQQVEGHENTYEIRVGQYRVVYEVFDEENALRVARLHMVE